MSVEAQGVASPGPADSTEARDLRSLGSREAGTSQKLLSPRKTWGEELRAAWGLPDDWELVPAARSPGGTEYDTHEKMFARVQDARSREEGKGLRRCMHGSSFHESKQAFCFQGQTVTGERLYFQLPLKAVGGSKPTAERISRICYAKFKGGASKDDIHELRKDLCRRACAGDTLDEDRNAAATADIKGGNKRVFKGRFHFAFKRRKHHEPSRPHDVACAPPTDAHPSVAGEGSGAGISSSPGYLPSLPPGSGAHQKVKWNKLKSHFHFQAPGAAGGKAYFQVSLRLAGLERDEGGHIAALCFAKFEAGATKDDVLVYRDELVGLCKAQRAASSRRDGAGRSPEDLPAPAAGRSAPPCRPEAGSKEARPLQDSIEDIRSAVAAVPDSSEVLLVQAGFDGPARRLDGLYGELPDKRGGRPSFRRLGARSRPAMLEYNVEKGRWRFTRPDDERHCYAYLKEPALALPPETSVRRVWRIFVRSANRPVEEAVVISRVDRTDPQWADRLTVEFRGAREAERATTGAGEECVTDARPQEEAEGGAGGGNETARETMRPAAGEVD
eukprot:CAMPEP_0117489586 /NCGR_PEP_ID=MMETSP0784-20121206/17111_1 /TAXON_ID=39447 /ORGANISM="" /LENGTH=558 /DNA_ID=CAMNT_0005284317 /DNA_START=112 /DNA_END=1785 /DNA_ORIENTATION=+